VEKKKKIPFLDYLKDETAAWIGEIITNAANRSTVTLQYR